MSKHTPGPWTVDVRESGAPGMGSAVVSVNIMAGENRVAGVTVRPGSKCLSNARLIAAAPDLLEAAKDFVAKVDRGDARSRDSYAKFNAAIAKAEGAEDPTADDHTGPRGGEAYAEMQESQAQIQRELKR